MIRKFDLWIADLNPEFGTEPGKIRPVVIVQSDLMNPQHHSTLVCPVSSNVVLGAKIVRVHIKKKHLNVPSDILVDQIRAIDNKRLVRRVGKLSSVEANELEHNIRLVLDL